MSTMSTIKFPGDSVAREIVDKLSRTNIGDLNELCTEDKASLVAAINEVANKTPVIDVESTNCIMLNLNNDICEYSIEELNQFYNENKNIVGKYTLKIFGVTIADLSCKLVYIDDTYAQFTAICDVSTNYWLGQNAAFALISVAISEDQSITSKNHLIPKVPLAYDDDIGYFLQATSEGLQWVESSGTVEVDTSLSISGMAADAKAVGNAINSISDMSKVVSVDMSQWDNNNFSVTLLNGATIQFNVEFNEQGEPISITDDNGLTTTITW